MSDDLLVGTGEDSLIQIPLYYSVTKNKYGIKQVTIHDDEEAENLLKEGKEIKKLSTKWKPQTWQMNNFLVKNSLSYNPATESQQFDNIKYEENVFSNCIHSWDLTDKDDKPIPPNAQTLGMLHTKVAIALIRKYVKYTTIDEEEQKKS